LASQTERKSRGFLDSFERAIGATVGRTYDSARLSQEAAYQAASLRSGAVERKSSNTSPVPRLPFSGKGNSVAEAVPSADELLGSEGNPFLAAIRDNFGTRPPPSKPDPKPQKDEIQIVKSPPPAPSNTTNQEVTLTSRTPPEAGSINYSSAYIFVGDLGNHKLQISAATKSGPASYALTVDGILGTVSFNSGLNLGPQQSFWVGHTDSNMGAQVVVTDSARSAAYLYSRVGPDQLVVRDNFVIPVADAIVSGVVLSDINNDGLDDLVVGVWFPEADQSYIYLFLQKNDTFVYNRRFLVNVPIGGIHISRSGGQKRILAVDQSLVLAEMLTLEETGTLVSRVADVVPVRKQDTKLILSDGRPLWIRLVEFSDATFLGSYTADSAFSLIGAVENSGMLPSMAVGDLQQNGQRRCWVHF
jgi:hypothetical protein